MSLKDKYPYLKHFFGCYFHQDWDDDYATAADGIKHFLQEPEGDIALTTAELKTFLSEIEDDKELRKAVIELGDNYEPAHDGLTVQEWLANQVLPMLEKHLAENKDGIARSV
jgi:hypothetical protein